MPQEGDYVDISCVPDVIEALESYEEIKETSSAQSKKTKRLLNGASARKPGRKKKTNKTGWPNKNRRSLFRKETCSTKDEDEVQSVGSEGKPDGAEAVSVDLDRWENAEKELAAKINNSEYPVVRVQKLDSEVMVRHKRSCSDEVPPQSTERRAKRTQSSPKSPRALRKPRGRWYRER